MSSSNSICESGSAASGRNRVVSVLHPVFCGFLIVVALVDFTFWIEHRCPRNQERQISADRHVNTEMAYLYPSLSLEEILRRFSDARIDPANRRLFAYRLA